MTPDGTIDHDAPPRLTALQQWIDGGRQGDIQWPTERWPDPPSWSNYATRLEAQISRAVSGARAVDSIDHVVEHTPTGRRLPPPRRKSS